jgi:hypothetical protein
MMKGRVRREPGEVFRIAERAVPKRLENAAVAIVRTGSTAFGHGSGTLFRVADYSFVVTAKHVIRDACDGDWPIGITGETEIVETPGEWAGSPETGSQPDRGLGDIAIYRLNEEQISNLGSREFVRLTDLGLHADLSGAFFRFLGFPVMWANRPTEAEPLRLGLFRYSTTAGKDTGHLLDYDPAVHFLLEAQDHSLVNRDGEEISLRSHTGHRVPLVQGVAGISGSCVWRIGRPGVSPEHWGQDDARVVGVVTGVYDKAQVIKATKWVFVTKLIYEVFPEVRPALDLQTLQRS